MLSYFVAYNWSDNKGNNGFGNASVPFKKQIKTFDDIKHLSDLITNTPDFPKGAQIIIINYKKL